MFFGVWSFWIIAVGTLNGTLLHIFHRLHHTKFGLVNFSFWASSIWILILVTTIRIGWPTRSNSKFFVLFGRRPHIFSSQYRWGLFASASKRVLLSRLGLEPVTPEPILSTSISFYNFLNLYVKPTLSRNDHIIFCFTIF